MAKQALGLRERRKIYEDTICVISQNQKIGASPVANERAMRNTIEKQTSRCVSILTTVLGCRETTVETSEGRRIVMLNLVDGNQDCVIEKKQFEDIVKQLPLDKELREALWKTCIKRDAKSTSKLNALIASK